MSERLNEKILEKLDRGSFDPEVKKFLKAILFLELRNFEIGERRYSQEYERNIRTYVSNYKVNK